MKLFGDKKGKGLIGIAISAVIILICVVIIGQVENDTTWVNSLSTTVGGYIETIGILAALATVGYMAYSAAR